MNSEDNKQQGEAKGRAQTSGSCGSHEMSLENNDSCACGGNGPCGRGMKAEAEMKDGKKNCACEGECNCEEEMIMMRGGCCGGGCCGSN